MSRIDAIFTDLRARKAKALMPFICGGYPAAGATAEVLPALEKAGASVVEVGIPFSDPIADGPVIAAAMHEALGRGVTPESVFEEIGRARKATGLGIVVMMSVSIAWRLGAVKLVEVAQRAGVDGFIFPDLPAEEGRDLLARVRGAGLATILLVAPTTTAARAVRIVKECSGFVYVLARAGITGESSGVPDVSARVRELRGMTDLPIACGFGFSTAKHVRGVVGKGGADAAIVGSALVRRMGEAKGEAVKAAGEFVRGLAEGLV